MNPEMRLDEAEQALFVARVARWAPTPAMAAIIGNPGHKVYTNIIRAIVLGAHARWTGLPTETDFVRMRQADPNLTDEQIRRLFATPSKDLVSPLFDVPGDEELFRLEEEYIKARKAWFAWWTPSPALVRILGPQKKCVYMEVEGFLDLMREETDPQRRKDCLMALGEAMPDVTEDQLEQLVGLTNGQ